MTLAISHTENKTQILDAVRERKPPFSPEAVAEEFAKLIRQYRCTTVYGDRYGGEWPREQFRKHGVNYEPSSKSKSEIYADLLPMLCTGFTDSVYLRAAGTPTAYGFSPFRSTSAEVLTAGFHNADERVHVDDLLLSVEFHVALARELL